jgi:hypothetical protein
MNKKRTRIGWRRQIALGAVLLGLAATWAWGDGSAPGITPPLYVGNLVPVLDQYGRPLAGSHQPSGAASRSLVEIRTTADGIVRPPYTNGAAHYKNPLLTADSLAGMGLNSAEANSGMFCAVFAARPRQGTNIFVRAYNAPTVAEATFYADSYLAYAPTNDSSLVVVFKAAMPLDPGDADGDGLNNSWERALGIDDRPTPDYDGDGMSDLHEMLAGTGPDDPGSLLTFRLVRREAAMEPQGEGEEEAPRPVRVRWQSVPGKTYQLEYVPMLTSVAGEPPIFVPVGEVVLAETGEFEIDLLVDVPDDSLTGTFRVKLVTEPQ